VNPATRTTSKGELTDFGATHSLALISGGLLEDMLLAEGCRTDACYIHKAPW